MSFKKDEKRQRCLLLFDEFPQFGRLEAVDLALALAVMAGYGLKQKKRIANQMKYWNL